MALDNSKQETDYTNRCGNAADWCVAAPGVEIVRVLKVYILLKVEVVIRD